MGCRRAVVRPMEARDLEATISLRVHGISRGGDLADAVSVRPLVAERDGRITAYMTAPSFWIANHGVADSEADMRAVIAWARPHGSASVVPVPDPAGCPLPLVPGPRDDGR